MTKLTVERTGLVTSLGHGAVESAAAARAGIVRPDTIDGVAGFDPEEMEVPLTCHPVRLLTDGFEQTGRWLQLAAAAVADCFGAGPVEGGQDPAALLLVLPNIDVDRYGWPEPEIPAIVQAAFVEPLRALTGLSLPCEEDWIFQGSGGTALALQKAEELLPTRRMDRVLVLAVDSWLDTPSLMTLEEAGRLKGPETPAGLMPGEAAACVCLTPSGGALAITSIQHTSTDKRPLETPADTVPVSQGLGTVLGTQLAPALAAEPQPHLYSDVNGEEWRSHVHGMALVKANESANTDALQTTYPAASFGDLGAAHALTALCLFEQATARAYSQAPRALILNTGEDGTVSTIGLEASTE